jgi:hypothetical protein
LGFLEGFQFHARFKSRHGEGQSIKANFKPFAIENLGHQAAIGQRRGVTKTVSRLRTLGQLALKRF